MKIDVEENLLEPNEKNSFMIEDEIIQILDNDEGQNIKADIELLKSMGFDKKMINKVYILLRPENIERAIDFMTEIDGVYQHDFIASSNPNEKSLCFICKKPINNHLDYIPDNLLIDADMNDNQINNHQIIIDEPKDIIDQKDDENDLYGECEVCYEEINKEDKESNTIPCGHLFCTHCWFNYLKTLISEAKVEKITCMDHGCKEIISEEFIVQHISVNENLIDKYKKFKKRADILQDKNKKLCPKPDCDSFLQKSELSKYVQCENGHKYCYDCLRPPHGDKSCDYNLEKELIDWTKGKRVKRCPRCKIYTEKNEGCNHMTCVNCKYQWCWLCEGEYKYGHYDSGKCQGQQFAKADYPKEIAFNNNNNENNNNRPNRLNRNNRINRNRRNYGFGLHKIFKCIFPIVERPFSDRDIDDICLKYLMIFSFLLFGILFIYMYIIINITEDKIQIRNCCQEIIFKILALLIGLYLFICFQIFFICLTSPFILICFIYHNFFEYFLILFGIGKSSNQYYDDV